MYEDLFNTLKVYSVELVTMGGRVHPYVGAAVALLVTVGLIFLGFKAKSQKWEDVRDKAGRAVGKDTGKDQQAAGDVLKQSDDFFGDKK